MFDVSFSELLVIAAVALVFIGPEKLPKVARTVGNFTGRMQRYLAQIKEEVNREVRFEELQKLQQEIKQSVENTQSEVSQFVDEVAGIKKKASNIVKPALKPTVKSAVNPPKSTAKLVTEKTAPAKKPRKISAKKVTAKLEK